MSCCWLWLFCANQSFLVDGRLGCWPRRASPSRLQRTGRRAALLCVKLGFPRSRCRTVVSDVFACVHMYILYACVYICVCVYACGHVYIYICACVYVYVYVCVYTHVYVYVCVCIFVHRLWVSVSVLQRVDSVMHAHVCSCAYVCVCICVYICAFFCCECCMHFGTGVLGTSALAGCTFLRCVFTLTYTSATHSLQVVYICVYLYICVYTCICI